MKLPVLLATMLLATTLRAQTYTPKAIRLEGVAAADRAEVMKRLALPEHVPLTRQQIEDGMGRLAETGNYTDLSYAVNSEALVITLKTAAGTSQVLPVRFENLVWWQENELERLLEARVPLYHGELPLTGSLTDEVRSALERLLAEKGVSGARVEVSMQGGGRAHGSGISSLSMTVAEPHVTLGKVLLTGVAPSASPQMSKMVVRLEGRDYERDETLETVRQSILDTHYNAGYLDATVSEPAVSAPRREGADWVVDMSATVDPMGLYKVSSIDVASIAGDASGVKPEDLVKATGIKAGDPAGLMAREIGAGQAARVFTGRGMLGAKVTPEAVKDPSLHTVAYHLTCVPGPVYTAERIDVSAMPADVGARLLKTVAISPGTRADADLVGRIMQALRNEGLLQRAAIDVQISRTGHTVVYAIRPLRP